MRILYSFVSQISSAWYRTCWVITGFYCIFWLCLAVLVLYEVFHSCLFPSHDRVVILGVGAGLNKLKVPKHAKSVMEIFKHKFPMPDVLKRAAKPHPGGARPGADGNIDARREAELELALMDDPTGNAPLMSPSQTDVRKNNFFGDSATEKRRGSQKDSALADDQTIIPSRPTSIVRVRSTNSVAPSPAESEDEAEEKRPSITTTGGLGGGKSFTVHPQRSDLAGEEEKENSSRGSGGEEDDPFQAKIAANKRAQEQRRRELAEITRATEAMAAQREQQQPAPPAFDPANLPPLSTANSGAPAGILRGPSTATNDRFKMVEFHHGSRLEEVKRIETEESRGESSAGEDGPWGSPGQSPSTMQNPQQQQQQFDQNRPPSQAPPKFLPPLEEYRGGPPVAQSPYSYAPLPPPSSMQQQPQQQQQPSLYPAGAQTPQNPAYGYTHIPAGSPYANAAGPGPQFASNYNAIPAGSPSAMASPLPSSSAMLPIGPVYPERGPPPPPGGQPPVMVRLDPNDPNRFSKLMQQRNAEQPQRGWPPPPPRQQGQPQQPPTNPARYNTIDDDLSF
jgi:hypothetical protein